MIEFEVYFQGGVPILLRDQAKNRAKDNVKTFILKTERTVDINSHETDCK